MEKTWNLTFEVVSLLIHFHLNIFRLLDVKNIFKNLVHSNKHCIKSVLVWACSSGTVKSDTVRRFRVDPAQKQR